MYRWGGAIVGAVLLCAAASAGEAQAAVPVATTGPATSIGSTTATVTGSVDPGGQSTSWRVEYGTSTSYGSETAAVAAGSGTTPIGITAKLAGLKPGTTYHYRLVATNGAGTSRGSDAVFTTLVPPAATTGIATSVGTTSATLNGTVDPNGRSTSYYFEYGTSTSYGSKTAEKSAGSATSAQPVASPISGLQVGRTYHFRIVATSDAGTATGSDVAFTTSSAPAVITGWASSIGTTSATLHGTVTPNGLSTSWWFEYGTTTRYGSRTSAQSAGSGTSARAVTAGVGGLARATTYHYRFVAKNTSGTTYGADRMFSTASPPGVETGVAQGIGPETATLNGTVDTKGRSTSWWFEYGTSTRYGTSSTRQSAGSKLGLQPVSASVARLAPATTYHFRLVARNDAGTTYGRDVSFTTTGVTLAAASQQVVYGGRVTLSGTVPTEQAGEQVVVFAQAFGSGSFRSVATVITGQGGAWTYLGRPQIATTYEASWHNGLSAAVSVSVHPRVTLSRLRNGRFVVRVTGGRSFAHRVVQFQRRVGTRWVTVKRVRLGLRSRAEFKATLTARRSTVRATFSINQAGPGFLGGKSRALTVVRRG